MTATVRRRNAATVLTLWEKAAALRQEWLGVAVAAGPPDPDLCETVTTRLYAQAGRARPRFVRVPSPRAALEHTAGIPGHAELRRRLRPGGPTGRPPAALEIAARWSARLAALDQHATHPDLHACGRATPKDGWPKHLPPRQALEDGAPLRVVLQREVREALWKAVVGGMVLPVRAALGPPDELPVCWYGPQDVSWIAHYDILRRLGLAQYPPALDRWLDDWAALATGGGWWWPGDEVCVLSDRPVTLTGVGPGAPGPLRVAYSDGWAP